MIDILNGLHADGFVGTVGMAIIGIILYYNRLIIRDLRKRVNELERVEERYLLHLEKKEDK